jgi:hypothetical protein
MMRQQAKPGELARLVLVVAVFIVLAAQPGSAAEPICSSPGVIFCEDFEAGPAAISPGIWADLKTVNLVVTTTPANVFSGTYALQVNWSAGQNDVGWLTRWFTSDGQATAPATGNNHTFARAYFKVAPNFDCAPNCWKTLAIYGNQITNPWSGFGQAGVCSNGTNFFTAMIATVPSGPFNYIFYTYHPDMPCPGGSAFGENILFSPPVQFQRGVWNCIELEVQLNTPGQHNGYQRSWINGKLASETLSMRWRDTTNLTNNAFQLTFSGIPAINTNMWVDNVVVSTQRIGCGPSADLAPSGPTGLSLQ